MWQLSFKFRYCDVRSTQREGGRGEGGEREGREVREGGRKRGREEKCTCDVRGEE